MRVPPHERFLGVPADADAVTMLRIESTIVDAKLVEAALRNCLAMIDRHPGAKSEDAELVRQSVRQAASTLRAQLAAGKPIVRAKSGPSQPVVHSTTTQRARQARNANPGITLTSFDRQVLGTLVGCGGWNHASRARLVSIAAAHRVTVHGLLTVIHGLNDYARSGGARLDVATITAGQGALVPASVDLPRRNTSSLAERLLPELKDPTPATTVKWSMIFGLFALVLGAALIALVIRNSGRARDAINAELANATPTPSASDTPANATNNTEPELNREPATYPQPPTFAVAIEDVVPDELLQACAGIPEELRHVAARVHVSETPAEAVYQEWNALVDAASRGWMRLDGPLDREIAAAVREVMVECSEKPTVSDRMLESLAVNESRIIEPIELSRRIWRVRTLAELAQSLRLSLAVRERCEQLLSPVLSKSADVRSQSPSDLALDALSTLIGPLVKDMEANDAVYETWALWLGAVNMLASSEHRDELFLDAATAILRTHVDLSHQSPSVNVLGRLLAEVDWVHNDNVRKRVEAWFDDVDGMTSQDLWVVTSIMSEERLVRWFSPSLILPQLADAPHRRRVRDQVLSAWPEASEATSVSAERAGGGVQVDAQLATRWKKLQSSMLSKQLVLQPEALASHLAMLTKLNESASLLERGEITAAENVMTWLDAAMAIGSVYGAPQPNPGASAALFPGQINEPGQALGADGVWAQAYAQLGNSADERIKMLRALRSTAGTDLGPVDAAVFVREVYRANPVDVRTMAQSMALNFKKGPNVSQQLLDQLPDAVATETTSEFLQQFTGRSLPTARSEQWQIDSRLVLIDHCLGLMRTDEMNIDRAALIIADAVANQGPAEHRDQTTQVAPGTPSEAAEHVRQAWAASVRGVVVSEPVPGDVMSMERKNRTRKRLANGPIQTFVANRIGFLELFAFTLTAEQPALRVTVSNMLSASSEDRAAMTDALQQAIEVELLLSKLHVLRIQEASAVGGGAS